MAHCTVPEAEQILDKEFPVLDKGFVRLVDYLGSDARIVQSARVSYGEGTKTYRQDKGLINYLLRNEHTSPFEQVVFTFHIKMPIFVARQWIRHRTARINEVSGRYSVMPDEAYIPDAQHINCQSEDNKQGRIDEPVSPEIAQNVTKLLQEDQKRAFETYKELLDMGIARELARIDLPLSLYTQWYWQMDLHNLFHFLKLRLDRHAQYEIRAYAQVILDIVDTVCPLACEAFRNHILDGVSLTRNELSAVKELLAGNDNPLKGRELDLFNEKLK
ncbi:MAG: FAD-dependent thymidylate synthase [Sphaerochaetaceae bacterium]|jgi:thymidylate synthase (FAD)|nr:FAD-dependent thymidylate synthase [Sphaerochaetaceae bacterium]NLO60430.1 FAD-dependent thymidylate synthase [Spirochaetales bacterium]MDD3671749.1 FAD-dependent thymidylate synthase [Sphaerochaetaceae bacterium]MDD4259581.1 FAD-dependent thymidylate synthase [Sphaerochaetaceae bacterium]MDD4763221.1 FAD-dependent thymidylate synthase [Sphaerochaetaceae bacterium]